MARKRTGLVLVACLAALGGVGYLAVAALRDGGRKPASAPGLEAIAPKGPRAAAGGRFAAEGPQGPIAANGRAPAKPEASRQEPAAENTGHTETTASVRPVHSAPAPELSGGPAPISNDEVLGAIRSGEPGFEVLASRVDLGSQTIVPRFEAGDVFEVDTFYRQMQATPETWSGPARWRFEVTRDVPYRGRPCLEFVVTRADGEDYPPSTYYVTRDLKLAGAVGTVTENGKRRTVATVPDEAAEAAPGAGVKAPLTIVPFDLPPLGADARVVPAGLRFDLEPGMGGDEAWRRRMPPPDALVGAGGPHLDVQFENPIDGTTVRQRWSADDMRWPVVSRTETTWSFRRKTN